MTYPYTGRDLFAEPETYAYAVCDRDDYLDDWKTSRQHAKHELAKRAISGGAIAVPHDMQKPPGVLALNSVLGQSPVSESALEPFVIKFEVFGRLFAWYGDSGRRHPDSPLANLSTYILFAERLCEIAEGAKSLKHLSTLLKLCDALTSQAAERFRPEDASRLTDVLDREELLVKDIVESE